MGVVLSQFSTTRSTLQIWQVCGTISRPLLLLMKRPARDEPYATISPTQAR